MSKNDLSLKPHLTKDDDVWWYEEPEGISIICSGKHEDHRVIISWNSIRAVLQRLDKK